MWLPGCCLLGTKEPVPHNGKPAAQEGDAVGVLIRMQTGAAPRATSVLQAAGGHTESQSPDQTASVNCSRCIQRSITIRAWDIRRA